MKETSGVKDEAGKGAEAKASSRDRVRKHRESLRAKGMRPVQRWVLDARDPELQAEIRRQCLALRDDPAEKEALEFIERAMDDSGWV